MKINRQDTNGVKPLLQTGELGFDNFASGGDKGRVYVGDGTVNIALAKKSEVDVKVVANVDITAGTATKVTYDAKGLVTNGTTLSAGDIPVLDAGKITTGTLPVLRGGTGTTTSTGTGSVVLSSSPVLVTPTIGVATGTSFNSITGLSSTFPVVNGVATIGTSTEVAKADHIHPSDTTKVTKVTSTDNAIVRFDGTTGAVQNSSVIIDDSGNLNLTGTGKRITGDFSNATVTNRVAFQTSTLNGNTIVSVVPNGTAQSSFSSVYNNSDGNNSSFIQISARPTTVSIDSSATGTGSILPMVFSTGGVERMRIDAAAGNVLVTGGGGLGYGTGSGGTVTQLTSKSSAVTLNKPTGKIIMNNEALTPSGVVSFSVYNTTINYADTICYSITGSITNINNYSITIYTREDSMDISITNKSSTSLSEPVEIMYSIIRGALS